MAETKETLIKSEILNTKAETKIPEQGMTDLRERTGDVPKEIKSWMEKIEEDPMNMKTVADDSGQPLLQPSPAQNPKIQLPLGRSKFVAGFKKTVDEAGRWLSTFILRLIKKNDGKVKFEE